MDSNVECGAGVTQVPFSSHTLMGNWHNDRALQGDRLFRFLQKKEAGELLTQKTSAFLEAMMKPVEELGSCSSAGCHVYSGNLVMVRASCEPRYLALLPPLPGHEDHCPGIVKPPCPVSGTSVARPTVRSVFILERCYAAPECMPIVYEEPLVIRTLDCVGELYLQSQLTYQGRQEAVVAAERSADSHWKILPRDKSFRLELEGEPVTAGTDVIISHVQTAQALALENALVSKTVFGLEKEVSTCTYVDQHKWETNVNLWQLMLGQSSTCPTHQ